MPISLAMLIYPLGKVQIVATLTSGQCQSACDNLAQTMADAWATQPTATGLSTVTSDFAAELARLPAITDSLVQGTLDLAYTNEQRAASILSGGYGETTGQLQTYITSQNYVTLLAHGPFNACDALDFVCVQTGATGLANFLATNSIQVDQYFADLFNEFCLMVGSGGYLRRFGAGTPAPIPASAIFPHANVDYINQFTTTSTTAGTLAAGTASLAPIATGAWTPGYGKLECYAGGAIGGSTSSYTITVTYTDLTGATGQTGTFTITKGATINTIFTAGGTYNVASIQSVAITTGTANGAGDILRFRLKPTRAVTA